MPSFIDGKCLWTPYLRHGQILSAGTSSGGSTFQSSSFCQGIAVWVGLCMKYHVLWSSPTSMSSSVGQQLPQLQVCSNGCISSAHGIPKWISRFLVLWCSLRISETVFLCWTTEVCLCRIFPLRMGICWHVGLGWQVRAFSAPRLTEP